MTEGWRRGSQRAAVTAVGPLIPVALPSLSGHARLRPHTPSPFLAARHASAPSMARRRRVARKTFQGGPRGVGRRKHRLGPAQWAAFRAGRAGDGGGAAMDPLPRPRVPSPPRRGFPEHPQPRSRRRAASTLEDLGKRGESLGLSRLQRPTTPYRVLVTFRIPRVWTPHRRTRALPPFPSSCHWVALDTHLPFREPCQNGGGGGENARGEEKNPCTARFLRTRSTQIRGLVIVSGTQNDKKCAPGSAVLISLTLQQFRKTRSGPGICVQ